MSRRDNLYTPEPPENLDILAEAIQAQEIREAEAAPKKERRKPNILPKPCARCEQLFKPEYGYQKYCLDCRPIVRRYYSTKAYADALAAEQAEIQRRREEKLKREQSN